MDDEQFAYAKNFMKRIVREKIPQAKRWSVPKEFESWIDNLSKDQFQSYLEGLRSLTQNPSDDEPANQASSETGGFILFGAYPLSEREKREELDRVGGEATAYYALALWRSLQAEELRQALKPHSTSKMT